MISDWVLLKASSRRAVSIKMRPIHRHVAHIFIVGHSRADFDSDWLRENLSLQFSQVLHGNNLEPVRLIMVSDRTT